MKCAWNALLRLLPTRLQGQVDELGRETAQELRLWLDRTPELLCGKKRYCLEGTCRTEDLQYIINGASRYSPWAAETMAQGYLTAPGGHRIGLGGRYKCRGEQVEGIQEVRSLCIRIARDFPGVGEAAGAETGSLLILGPPGWGKTTLLRDVIRQRSRRQPVSVVDERGELFPDEFDRGRGTDVLTGCPKAAGVLMALRTLSPGCIAMDEITRESDSLALLQAANCGVTLLATAHAASAEDLKRRSGYRGVLSVFDTLAILNPDKTYRLERMAL